MESNEIKALMRERGLTYAAIGAEIGVTAQAVWNVVNGTSGGRPLKFAVAKVLGVDVAKLWPADDAGVAA